MTKLSPDETSDLRCLAAMIIPASDRHGVPGADDPVIFADILRSLGRDGDAVRAALGQARAAAGGGLDRLDQAGRDALAARLQAETTAQMAVLTRIVLLCYYRDDRVLLSLGLEPRPPFPKGHVVEQGDWSLLDKVKARAPFWRAVS
jgi:hypothetical protein